MLKLQDQLGDFELIRPGRQLIKEGELKKISRKVDNPRYFILLVRFIYSYLLSIIS